MKQSFLIWIGILIGLFMIAIFVSTFNTNLSLVIVAVAVCIAIIYVGDVYLDGVKI